ncbi:MAG: hypothetical protein AUJ12_04605 [Alphaproteobacteria bacterium CG1_02_46_17]|nr:MAG: hypothetical protein AUJ12_04605 [Alphaproteobacteria bacterium CG1_02_46_17]
MKIDTAFVLAAGKGTRMAPLTDSLPKPLVSLNDRPLLDYIFDYLKAEDVQHLIVNAHHLPDKISQYLDGVSGFTSVDFVQEPVLLETGGGLKNAAQFLPKNAPFFMINGDAFWVDKDGTMGALAALSNTFDANDMDILLLLIPVLRMTLTQGVGDYDIAADGRLIRAQDKTGDLMFTGIRIVHPRILESMPDGVYSFLQQMDAAEESGRLYGVVYDGDWHHISTPEDVDNVEKSLV